MSVITDSILPPPLSMQELRIQRCLQVGAGWFPEQSGGLNRYFFELLHQLPRHDIQSTGLVVGSAQKWPKDPLVGIHAFSPLNSPLALRCWRGRHAIARAISLSDPQVIAGHFAPYVFPALSKIASILPLVFHFHGPWAAESREEGGNKFSVGVKYHVERAVYLRAKRLVVLSKAFADILVKNYAVDVEKIDVIPGGVDCNRFDIPETRAQARAALRWPTDRPIVLAVRRLVRRMGLENLIDAVIELRKQVPDVLVMIAGAGPLREELNTRISNAQLHDHVRLLGYLPDENLPRAYRAADLSVVPSVALEGFGLIAVESLAAGTPALVTDVGGLPSVVQELSSDLICAHSSSPALAEKMHDLLRKSDHRLTPAACRQHAGRFDWLVVMPALLRVYEAALA